MVEWAATACLSRRLAALEKSLRASLTLSVWQPDKPDTKDKESPTTRSDRSPTKPALRAGHMTDRTSIHDQTDHGHRRPAGLRPGPGLATWLDALAWWVFPRRCPSCGEAVSPAQTFCPTCITALHPIKEPLCPLCFLPFESGPNHLCGRCTKDPPPFERAVALFEYGGSAAQAIKRLKYGSALDAAACLGRLMAGHLAALDPDIVCPIPLHPLRLRRRGFNQAMELARHACKAAGLPRPRPLVHRIGNPEPQAAKSLSQRKKMASNQFVLRGRKERIQGRRVVLIDDVVTTQATARAAARVLVAAGAQVSVLALARTPL